MAGYAAGRDEVGLNSTCGVLELVRVEAGIECEREFADFRQATVVEPIQSIGSLDSGRRDMLRIRKKHDLRVYGLLPSSEGRSRSREEVKKNDSSLDMMGFCRRPWSS